MTRVTGPRAVAVAVAEPLLVALVVAATLLLRPPSRRPGPWTRRRAGPAPAAHAEPDHVAVVDLLAVAVEAGASVPRALEAVGVALGGRTGADLGRAGAALLLGASWPAAWVHAPSLGRALAGMASAWDSGTAAGPALRTAAAELRRHRDRAAREAAGRLGVRLVLPLGLCFLPAFVLVGLVPVLVSLARSLLG